MDREYIAAQRVMGLIITGVTGILTLAGGIELYSVVGLALGYWLMSSKTAI